MSLIRRLLMLGLAGACSGTALAQGVDPVHAHAHAASADAAVDATPYATDAPLRAGMAAIQDLLSAERPADDAAAAALATAIQARVQQLFAECKLAPAADAALHGVLAQLLDGAAALRADHGDEAAWARLESALTLYAERFDDPRFRR